MAPYQRLWCAVLLRAFLDACNHREQSHAMAFLRGQTRYFNFVCHAAGFNPDYVRQKAKNADINAFTQQLYNAYSHKNQTSRGVAKLKGIIMKGTTKKGGKGGKGTKGC